MRCICCLRCVRLMLKTGMSEITLSHNTNYDNGVFNYLKNTGFLQNSTAFGDTRFLPNSDTIMMYQTNLKYSNLTNNCTSTRACWSWNPIFCQFKPTLVQYLWLVINLVCCLLKLPDFSDDMGDLLNENNFITKCYLWLFSTFMK